MAFKSRPYILREANLAQLREFKPNVAILPWGATEAHNLHLPHGMDFLTAEMIADAAVTRAVEQGARPVLLPCLPFGNDNMQLTQVATITMRSRTQQLVLHDVAESLLRQGIDRLIVLNFHGGNDFKQMIRDIVLDLPMFIVQVNAFQLAPDARKVLDDKGGDHANEYETSLAMHLYPDLVAPLETAGDGAATPSKIPALSQPGVWTSRNWAALTKDTGVGNPKKATAEKGKVLFEAVVSALVPVIVQVSAAKHGDFPYVIPGRKD